MLAAHYSTALLAYQKFPKGTLWFFLIASQLQDLVWLLFHYLGLEPTLPEDLLNVTLQGLNVDMIYSHDLLPQLFWAGLAFLAGKLIFKSNAIGFAGAILVIGHFILDLLSGYPHHVFGPDSHPVGLALYISNVHLAISIEAVFVAVVLWLFFRQEAKKGARWSLKDKCYILGLFLFGVLFLFSVATTSFRQLFGIPEFHAGFNSSMPSLIFTYLGMMLYLHFFIGKAKRKPSS